VSRLNVFQQRHAHRTDALNKALDIVKENEFLLTPESTMLLRKHILARFIEGEIHDLAQQPLDTGTQDSTLFRHTPGRRR
jgi:hypothetical protein